jgi:hypothetical protein
MASHASDQEQQRRELEEIRRQFAEVSRRTGSAFEPAAPDKERAPPLALVPPDQQPAPPAERPTRPRWQWVAAAVLLLVGTGIGYALPRAGSNDPPAPPPPSTAPPPASTQPPAAAAGPRTVTSVPEACLETARRGDEVLHLFTINDRGRRLAEALKAYTLASQACRKEASP